MSTVSHIIQFADTKIFFRENISLAPSSPCEATLILLAGQAPTPIREVGGKKRLKLR